MRNKIKIILFTTIIILWMGFIFSMSAKNSMQSSSISGDLIYNTLNIFEGFNSLEEAAKINIVDELQFIVRKSAHFMAYAILGGLCFIDIGFIFMGKNKLRFKLAFAITALYAAIDEIHQYFVPGRSCELRDVFIDSCGALTGIAFIAIIGFILRCIRNRRNIDASIK